MYVKKPFTLVPALNTNTLVYVFSYAGNASDFAADRTAFYVELAKHLLYNPGITEYGIGCTGTDLTIGASTTSRTIALAAGVIGTDVKYPVVLYKGTPIPFSDFLTVQSATPQITLRLTTVTLYPSTTNTDYKVFFTDPVLGIVTNVEAGGVSLPLESNEFKALGHEEPVIKTVTRGDPEGTGSISVVSNMTSVLFDSSTVPKNNAGEDLLARIYGSEWTANAGIGTPNILNFPTNPFGITILKMSGLRKGDAGNTGKIFLRYRHIYHCMVTNIGAPQNLDNDSTDPVIWTVEYTSKYATPGFGTVKI
jgi:hypothetical protein